jgi:hypothetical protein
MQDTSVGNCGIPYELIKGNFTVGLNYNSNNGSPLYANGANCGRWVEIEIGID